MKRTASSFMEIIEVIVCASQLYNTEQMSIVKSSFVSIIKRFASAFCSDLMSFKWEIHDQLYVSGARDVMSYLHINFFAPTWEKFVHTSNSTLMIDSFFTLHVFLYNAQSHFTLLFAFLIKSKKYEINFYKK